MENGQDMYVRKLNSQLCNWNTKTLFNVELNKAFCFLLEKRNFEIETYIQITLND